MEADNWQEYFSRHIQESLRPFIDQPLRVKEAKEAALRAGEAWFKKLDADFPIDIQVSIEGVVSQFECNRR